MLLSTGTSGGGSGGVVSRLLRQDLAEVDFGLRRFRLRGGPARARLEDSGRAFLEGFNEAVSRRPGDGLAGALETIPEEFRGFSYEGAGMACALLDLLTVSGGRRLRSLLAGPGQQYPHLIHVGVGWAFARLRLRPWRALSAGDPMLRWLAWDGFGFHQGFFASDRVVGAQGVESRLAAVPSAIRDQGLGRSLWFHECADPEAVALRLREFPEARRADLWSGIGLAATYAGGATDDELHALAAAAGPFHAHLAQGSAFAAAARQRSGLALPEHCQSAARILTGASADTAAGWTDRALADIGSASAADYLAWRAGIRNLWFRQHSHDDDSRSALCLH